MNSKFHLKDLGDFKYCLGLVALTAQGIVLSKRKYALDVLEELKMSNYKALRLPLNPNTKLTTHMGTLLDDPNMYRRLTRKLVYLSITKLNINFNVQLLSQFMHKPINAH